MMIEGSVPYTFIDVLNVALTVMFVGPTWPNETSPSTKEEEEDAARVVRE